MTLIAVSMRVDEVSTYKERRDSIDQQWYKFLERCGCTPICIPNTSKEKTEELLGLIRPDGVLLTGGNTISEFQDQNSLSAPERDQTELALFEYAINKNKSILGVCRGMQYLLHLFNVEQFKVSGHVAQRHNIYLNLDDEPFVKEVNSFHSWSADKCNLPADLRVLAYDHDLLEGFIHTNKKIMGVMWHPEREHVFDEVDINLIKEFFND